MNQSIRAAPGRVAPAAGARGGWLLAVTAAAARGRQLRRARRLLRRRAADPEPAAAARLPQVEQQLRAPGGAGRSACSAPRRDLQRRRDRRHDRTRRTSNPDGPNPPQFNSLDADTTVVSLTIGGNDIGFSEVAQSCITLNPFSHPCLDKYNAGGVDQLKARIEATAPKVAAVLQGIHARSPLAKIYVVNYPAIFPETGFGCWPQMPIGFSDVPYLRSTEQRLNAMLATQAAANGATLVNWYSASIGHDACKGTSTRWVEPLVPGHAAAPIHPNKAGMQGGANALLAAVN